MKKDLLYVIAAIFFGPLAYLFIPNSYFKASYAPQKSPKWLVALELLFSISLPTFVVFILATNPNAWVDNQPPSVFTLVSIWLSIFFVLSALFSFGIFPSLGTIIRKNKFLFVLYLLIITPLALSAVKVIVGTLLYLSPDFPNGLVAILGIVFSLIVIFGILKLKDTRHRLLKVIAWQVLILSLLAILFFSLVLSLSIFFKYDPPGKELKSESTFYKNPSMGYSIKLYPEDDKWIIQEYECPDTSDGKVTTCWISSSVTFYRLNSDGGYDLTIEAPNIKSKNVIPPENFDSYVEGNTKLINHLKEVERQNVSSSEWRGIKIDYSWPSNDIEEIHVYLQSKDQYFKIAFKYKLAYWYHENKELNRKKAREDFDLMLKSLSFN